MKKIIITGAAGFIGFHTAKLYINKGYFVLGIDNLNDSYDYKIKKFRIKELQKFESFLFKKVDISNKDISFEIAESLDVNIQKLNRALEDGEAATLLRAEVDTSIEFGVFGSPTFRVDNELFFGVEKMEVLNEWLTLGGW